MGDLHCHTRLSDGSMGIDDLILLAKKRGLSTIAITDHDCQAGTVRGRIIGERHGVHVIPGVELSSTHAKSGKEVHIIGYLSDSPDRLEGLCRRNLLARKKAGLQMVLKVSQRYPCTPELVGKCASGSTNIYTQHIMHALMEYGITDSIFGELYEELFSPQSKNNVIVKPAFPEPYEIINAIHDAGGIAVYSHPSDEESMFIVEELLEYGLDGIEVWAPPNGAEQTERLRKFAEDNSLLMTGGSDFHGMYGNGTICIGASLTPEEQLSRLTGYKTKQRRLQQKAADM